jgi:hypothetical protein
MHLDADQTKLAEDVFRDMSVVQRHAPRDVGHSYPCLFQSTQLKKVVSLENVLLVYFLLLKGLSGEI